MDMDVTCASAARWHSAGGGQGDQLGGQDAIRGRSLRAGAYAAGLARRQRSRLVVVYVGPVASLAAAMPGAGGAVAVAHDEAFDQTSDDLRRQVEGQAQERGIAVTFVARRGDPFSELRRVAAEVRADAVVVGASAKAGHRLVGSVAVRLVRAGEWPVTVVP
jgi:nucleotide-binding universal stress UspA family protein